VDDRIPTHSALLGAWVQAGLLGAVFWMWVLSVALRAGFRMFLSSASLPLAAYMIVALMWDALFSPCAMEQRILTSAYLSCAMLLLQKRV
jgi:O-antigen ligase